MDATPLDRRVHSIAKNTHSLHLRGTATVRCPSVRPSVRHKSGVLSNG